MKIRIPLYAQHLNQAEFVQLMSSTVDTLKQYRSSSNDPWRLVLLFLPSWWEQKWSSY